VDGGYEIINYILYRDASLKDAEAERKRLYRERIKVVRTEPDDVRTLSASVSVSNISFDLSSLSWCGISDDDVKGWKEAYPACDIKIELAKMKEWVLSNKAKGKKSNWRRFITNWLSRSQDRGGTKKGKQSMADWVKEQEGA